MEYTKNLNLKKPDVNEYYDIEKNNENMDLIDTAVGELNKKINYSKIIQDKWTLTTDSNGNIYPSSYFTDKCYISSCFSKNAIVNYFVGTTGELYYFHLSDYNGNKIIEQEVDVYVNYINR